MPGHYRNGNGGTQTNLITAPNQFINRTTGAAVPAGMPYHVHDGQAMAGGTHSSTPHDSYDPMPSSMVATRPSRRSRVSSRMATPAAQDRARRQTMSTSTPRTTMSSGYRRGGRVNNRRKMMHGGSHSRNNGCGPGMMYQNGGCVPASGGMRRGGSTRRRMRHGGHHHHMDPSGLDFASRASNMHTHTSLGTGAAATPQYIGNGYAEWDFVQQNTQTEGPHNHNRHASNISSVSRMRRGGRPTRRMMHGGRNNGTSDHHRKSAKRDSRGRK